MTKKAKKGKQELTAYVLEYAGPPAGVAVVFGYGRGHAIKQLAKQLEKRGLTWQKTDTVRAIESDNKRGEVFFATEIESDEIEKLKKLHQFEKDAGACHRSVISTLEYENLDLKAEIQRLKTTS